jgi:spore coat polysaccharide biosynthesis protein SpsF
VTTAVIVQARMGSSRLPGKVMKMLAGRTVLRHVLDRCREINGADVVVCAVPDEATSAPLVEVAAACRARVFRGSEFDVLDRYLGAARWVNADVVMRVTSDCPLVDPQICSDVLALRQIENADYAANDMPRSFPHGLDAECFTTVALEEAAASTMDPYDREHVTPWLRRAGHLKRVNLASGNPKLRNNRWTLDYPEDLAFLRAVFEAMPSGSRGHMDDVLAVLAAQPDISTINKLHHCTGP